MRRAIRLKYLNAKGRFPSGRTRYYYRRGGKQIPLPDFPPDHPEFLAQYATAAKSFGDRPQTGPQHRTGSIGAGIRAFMASDHFLSRAASTREVWRRILEKLEDDYGKANLDDLRPRHIRKDLAQFAAHPANNRLKVWRSLCKWCVSRGLMEANPAKEVDRFSVPKSEGHPPWNAGEIEKFRTHWPYDTDQRLAFELAYWTGARRSDVVRLGPGMVDKSGWLVFTQKKTGGRVEIPLWGNPPDWAGTNKHLVAALKAQKERHMTWLVTKAGHARSEKAFGAWFSKAVRAAEIPVKTIHGLRKSRGALMRENGATVDQRMEWLGHKTRTESDHYARSAEARKIISGTESAHSPETSAHKSDLYQSFQTVRK